MLCIVDSQHVKAFDSKFIQKRRGNTVGNSGENNNIILWALLCIKEGENLMRIRDCEGFAPML
jgi:hypothetical protein